MRQIDYYFVYPYNGGKSSDGSWSRSTECVVKPGNSIPKSLMRNNSSSVCIDKSLVVVLLQSNKIHPIQALQYQKQPMQKLRSPTMHQYARYPIYSCKGISQSFFFCFTLKRHSECWKSHHAPPFSFRSLSITSSEMFDSTRHMEYVLTKVLSFARERRFPCMWSSHSSSFPSLCLLILDIAVNFNNTTS